MTQSLPPVAAGDKCIILVDGAVARALNRVPKPGAVCSNVVVGGRAELAEPTEREQEICARPGPVLRERGLLFVGIDVIGGWLTEINVTSPTGLRALEALGGPNIAAMIWDAVEEKAAGRTG